MINGYQNYYKSLNKVQKPYKPRLAYKHSAQEAMEYALAMIKYEKDVKAWDKQRHQIETKARKELTDKKGKIHKLDPRTLKVLGVYDSVKQAETALNLFKGAISMVLCNGNTAGKYITAGGFKWERSTRKNEKYTKQREQLQNQNI